MSVFEITLLSIRRRMPQIVKAVGTTLAAVFFVTAVLIFQENMYQWQMSSNKSRFGDWFICEVTSKEPNNSLSEHAYLNAPVKAVTCVDMFNKDWKMTGYILGSFDEAFVKQGRLKLDAGHLPQEDDEIAMDWNTLLSLGYTGEIGETITIRYCEENSVYNNEARHEKQFRLSGIFANYTSIWKYGKKMPGAVVTENALSAFNTKCKNSYLYSLKESVRTSDYAIVYKKIKEDAKTETEYNSAVYDYQPWNSATVYAYMYIVVMVIGILALSYQLIEYRGRRKTAYQRFRRLGMDKSMMRKMYITENALIIIPAGIAGLLLALLTGQAIGKGLEINNGFHFYKITAGIIIKSVCSVIAAIVVEELAGLIANQWQKNKSGKVKSKNKKIVSANMEGKQSRIKPYNLASTISQRLMQNDGVFMIAGLRIFALCICGILVFSAVMIRKSYADYKKNNELPDIYGYLDPSDSEYEMTLYYYSYIKGYYNIPEQDDIYGVSERSQLLNKAWKERNRFNISFDELKSKMNNSFMRIKYNDEDLLELDRINIHYGRRYCKRGNTNLLSGFTSEFLEEIDNISGIESISYSAYESERKWFWDNQDYHKMGLDMISPDTSESRDTPITDYGYRYIFSTEYVNPTKELYKKLEKYIDKEYRNYDDFVNGRQVVVFLQDAPDGSYDDTLKAGDTLNYNYYELPVDASFHVPMSIADGRYVYPYDKAFFDKYNNSGKIDLHAHYYGSGGNMIGGTGTENPVREQVIDGYEVLFGACVSPTVAAVIKVTDDVREDFNGIMADYGYYTALAGMSLAQQAVDNQRNLMERMTGDEMTGDLEFGLHYNQLSVQYDLSSAFSATNNKLSVYFENNDLVYNSNVDAKNIYRTQLINNILQYGITIAAAVVIQLLIMAIVVRNRIERRKERYKLLHGLGMRRETIVRICMIEALRESVWCVLTMPLILIMELIMYTRKNLVE